MKNKKIILLIIISVASIFVIIRPGIETYWTMWMDFTHPGYYDSLEKSWENKSTKFLIGKLGHPSMYDSIASSILSRRKDQDGKDEIIRMAMDNSNITKRSSALSVLFVWDENKAVEIYMNILKIGRSHPLYSDALLHLSKIKYELAYQYATALAAEPDRYTNGSAAYLADFGKTESLPILEEMLKNTSDGLYRIMIARAIHSIKEENINPSK